MDNNTAGDIGIKSFEVMDKVRKMVTKALTRKQGAYGKYDPGSFYGKVTSPKGKAAMMGQGNIEDLPFDPLFLGSVQAVPRASQALIQQVRAATNTKSPEVVKAVFDRAKQLSKIGKDVSPVPWHQAALEYASNTGNKQLIQKVLKLIPKSDPYKSSMMNMFSR